MQSLNIEWLFLKIYDLIFKPKEIIGDVTPFLDKAKSVIGFLLTLIAIFFIGVIIYSIIRLKERKAEDSKNFSEALAALQKEKEENKSAGNKKWTMVIDFITSSSPSDWRIAIIEADNLLDELTKDLDLQGETLGERLKNAPESHFKTLDNAWRAHKVRNKIAHEGTEYEISYTEAKKTVELYESVFREFDYI